MGLRQCAALERMRRIAAPAGTCVGMRYGLGRETGMDIGVELVPATRCEC